MIGEYQLHPSNTNQLHRTVQGQGKAREYQLYLSAAGRTSSTLLLREIQLDRCGRTSSTAPEGSTSSTSLAMQLQCELMTYESTQLWLWRRHKWLTK